MLNEHLQTLPLIAILRGVTQHEIEPIGQALYDAGFRIMEVPLNSPEPLESIVRLDRLLGDRCLIGAGTVTRVQQVRDVAHAGGKLIVSPHGDPRVVQSTKAAGLVSAPGVATPTEAFAALNAGADVLKMFPAEQLGPKVIKAWRAVLPPEVALLPVGGITPDNMQAFVDAGAGGFGLGSALYKPGMSAEEVGRNARAFADAWQVLKR